MHCSGMATSSLNSVRVRLYFDYPPPATPECRMCWLLVNLNKCRVVADLSSIIKEKFGYSRRTILDLYIEDCYLPPTESIYIVRDNDSIRVKASSAVYINGEEVYQNPEAQNSKTKKRGREDETQINEGLSKKKKHEDAQINGSAPAEDEKKKKKKEVEESATKHATLQKKTQTQSSTKNNRKGIPAVLTSDKKTYAKTRQPMSSSSDSSEDESHYKTPPPKPKPKQNGAAKKSQKESTSSSDDTEKSKSNVSVQWLLVTPKLSSTTSKLPLQTPQRRESSTDSSSSSSSPSQARTIAKKSEVATLPSSATAQSVSSSVSNKPQDKAESSDSEASEIDLVIKKPNLQGMGLNIVGLSPGVSEAANRDRGNTRGQERGRGRGASRGSGRGGFGRAKGTPWKQDFHFNYENGERQKKNDSLTNESFIVQNPPEIAPRRDYTALPLLAAPPAVGQKKLLELTENYTPEVSDYKEAKIIAFNPQTEVMELELLSQPQASAEPGKFDLVYQNPDGSERVEYAVTHGSQLTERWDSLLEPRLIVENVG
ncbi:coilin-like isoform X2 [Carassius carassius]|uniref:coilin-like isoform X2 n=1 Tax=Carassius carassius TaxID=217509 RepID=UPI0028685D86|nr:coilin-like isoform X2 [Carassius carassius]